MADTLLKPILLLPEERSRRIKIGGHELSLEELAKVFQGNARGRDTLHDPQGVFLQTEDIVDYASRYRLNPKEIAHQIGMELQETPDQQARRAEAAIGLCESGEISLPELLSLLQHNPYALGVLHRAAASRVAFEDRLSLLHWTANLLEIREKGGPPFSPEELSLLRELFDQAVRLFSDPAVEPEYRWLIVETASGIATHSPGGQAWLKQLFGHPVVQQDKALRRIVVDFFGSYARKMPYGIREGLVIARALLRETGSLAFMAEMAPYLSSEDLASVCQAMEAHPHPTRQRWYKENERDLFKIIGEAALRTDEPHAARILELALQNFAKETVEELVVWVRFGHRDQQVLERLERRTGLTRTTRMLVQGHLARLDPPRYGSRAIDRILSRDLPLAEKRALLMGLRGLDYHQWGEPLREAIRLELVRVKGGRLDKDLTPEELSFVVVAREVVIQSGTNPLEVVDPREELNRRFRSLGEVRRRREGVLGPEYHSEFGFVGPDEDVLQVMEHDESIVARHGVSFEELSEPLFRIREHHLRTREEEFVIVVNDRRYRVTLAARNGWNQTCPFVDSTNNVEYDYLITDEQTGETLFFAGLLAHLIGVHHFFEGDVRGPEGHSFRMEPERLIRFFHFTPL